MLFRFQQPDEPAWGVDYSRGFQFDWCEVGGRWSGWGRRVRQRLSKQKVQATRRPIPRLLEPNAAWSDDLGRVRWALLGEWPLAIITPHGEWVDCPSVLPILDKPTVRQRRAEKAWFKKIQKIMNAYSECLAVAVDFHS